MPFTRSAWSAFSRKKRLIILGLAVFFACLGGIWTLVRSRAAPQYATQPFRMGFEDSPPMQYRGKGGGPEGPAVEIISEAARRRHIPLEWVYSPGPDAALTSGTVDLWPQLMKLPERRDFFYISEPWISNVYWMVSLASKGIATPGDTKGRIVWYRADRMTDHLLPAEFPDARTVAQPDNTAVFEGVCSGRADAGIISGSEAHAASFQQISKARNAQLTFFALPGGNIGLGVAASFKRPGAIAAADEIRDEIVRMSQDGTLSAIYLHWFSDPNNETTSIFYLNKLEQRNVYMIAAIAVLGMVLALLGLQSRRLREARQAADAANAAKSEFLANMSHEIRTPLNGVIGMTSLTLETELTPQQKDFLTTAYQSAETLLTVVNDILDFSKIEAGKLQLENIGLDLRELVESCAKAFALRAHQKKLDLGVELSPACPPFIQGDPTRLRQVLFNLLGNALKFTLTGEVVLLVAPVDTGAGPFLQFSVRDTGIGISAEKQARLFSAFTQADASTTRKFGGTGLGLAISKRLVELMGGRIWLESQPDVGTTFFFTIPLVAADSVPQAAASPDFSSLRQARILIVDDNDTNKRILQEICERQHIRTSSVSDGKSALQELLKAKTEGDPYRLVLVDYNMPGMDGLELAGQIGADRALSDSVIMMLTSDDCNVTTTRCQQVGIRSYLIKPIRQQELLSTIKNLLSGSVAESAAKKPAAAGMQAPAQSPVRKLRILLAEDNVVNQKVTRQLLQKSGHQITVAENGKQTVVQFRSGTFDLILMDVQMPEMDGLEATALIRKEEAATGSHVPIIALTAFAMAEDYRQCIDAGMDGYLAKPIKPSELENIIHSVVVNGSAAEPEGRDHAPARRTFRLRAQWLWPALAAAGVCAVAGWWVRNFLTDPSRASRPFRIGFQQSPPYQMVGNDGRPEGPAVDMIKQAAQRRHIPLEWVHLTQGPEPSLKSGVVDLWPLLGDIPERRKVLHISAPWVTISFWMATLKSSDINTPRDTVGRTVGYPNSFSIAQKMAHAGFPGARLVPQPSVVAAMEGAYEGKTDAAMITASKADAAVFRELPPEIMAGLKYRLLPNGNLGYGIGASWKRPGSSRAADAIRDEINQMAREGIVSAIYFHWFLSPDNETTAFSYLAAVEQRNRWLAAATLSLGLMLGLLGWQSRRLREARQAADAANIAKSEFLANMSHEIRTPLNGVIGMTSLTLETELTPQQKDFLTTASQSAETLLTVVNDILDFSKIEAGKLQLENIGLDLRELVESCAKAFAPRIQQKKLHLGVELSPACPPFIQGDPTRLRQVLFNLLGNALKFTPSGKIVLLVAPVDTGAGSFLQFSVRDTGIGISAEKQARLFSAFTQADASTTRKFGGTGLGLAISKRLVELMGGRIWLESQPDVGTTFFFTIPLVAADSVPQATPAPQPNLLESGPLHILLAEDNAVNQKVAVQLLQKGGHTITLAENGKQAVAQFNVQHFDLILMDVQMPEMDGFEATDLIRKKEALMGKPRTPIIALTAFAMAEDYRQCIAAGMDGYLTKPIKPAELAKMLAAVAQSHSNLSSKSAVG